MYEFEKILLDVKENIATLTLNDPAALNAMSMPLLAGFAAALDVVEDPKQNIRCLIITGAGRGFCAGANIMDGDNDTTPSNMSEKPRDLGAGLETIYHPLLRRLRNLHCPIITAVNGPAAGVGFSFAMMGDMIIAAKSAFFLQAFRGIGLVPDGGSSWLLPRLIGVARAKELMLMGERLPAEQALHWGLVNRLCEDNALADATWAVAQNLAQGPMSLKLIRTLVWESSENTYEQQLNLERQMQRIAGHSADFAEGTAAFAEKRPAQFTGE